MPQKIWQTAMAQEGKQVVAEPAREGKPETAAQRAAMPARIREAPAIQAAAER